MKPLTGSQLSILKGTDVHQRMGAPRHIALRIAAVSFLGI